MKIISNKAKLLKLIKDEKKIGFVPTMGAIHLGHLSLIDRSIKECKKTIVSIFINKYQFNKKNDYNKYPRVIKKDIHILKKARVDYLYLPSISEIYPNGRNKNIRISSFSKKLCGRFRPQHFESIVDVVDRFAKIIKPKRIYLGEKDMQQFKIIESFFISMGIKTKVIKCKTIREKNGIAFSSRNLLLNNSEKNIGSIIYKYILKNKNNIIKKKLSLKAVKKKMLLFGATNVDYVEIYDINKVTKPYKIRFNFKIFIAYYLRSTRMIDNI